MLLFVVRLECAFFSNPDTSNSSVHWRVQMTNADAERRRRLRKRHFKDREKERVKWVSRLYQ